MTHDLECPKECVYCERQCVYLDGHPDICKCEQHIGQTGAPLPKSREIVIRVKPGDTITIKVE